MSRTRGERGGSGVALVGVFSIVALVVGLAVPLYLSARNSKQATERGLEAVAHAEGAEAELLLRRALTAAQVYLAENGGYTGLSPQAAQGYDPTISYNASPQAVEGQVSIRGVSPTSVALVTRAASGEPMCVGDSAGVITYGRVDAGSAAQCAGGWRG